VVTRVVIVLRREYGQFSIIFVLSSQYRSHSVLLANAAHCSRWFLSNGPRGLQSMQKGSGRIAIRWRCVPNQSCPKHNRNSATAFLFGQPGELAISCLHGFWDKKQRLYSRCANNLEGRTPPPPVCTINLPSNASMYLIQTCIRFTGISNKFTSTSSKCEFYYLPAHQPGSSVGIATGYGLDGPRIEPRWGCDFSQTSRPALGPTQPSVQWVPGLSRG
jgi:hypothetical protein